MNSQYLLDTNICIEIARGRHRGIQKRIRALSYGEVAICSIVWAELELGAHLSPKGYARARTRIEVFSLLPQWPFDRASAERYAELRADLQRRGQLIAPWRGWSRNSFHADTRRMVDELCSVIGNFQP